MPIVSSTVVDKIISKSMPIVRSNVVDDITSTSQTGESTSLPTLLLSSRRASVGASDFRPSRRLTRELEKFTRPDQRRSTINACSNDFSLKQVLASTVSRLSSRRKTEGASGNKLSERGAQDHHQITRAEQPRCKHGSQTSSQDEEEEADSAKCNSDMATPPVSIPSTLAAEEVNTQRKNVAVKPCPSRDTF